MTRIETGLCGFQRPQNAVFMLMHTPGAVWAFGLRGQHKNSVTSDIMTATNIIHELGRLPLAEQLYVIEQTLRAIRTEKERSLKQAVDSLYEDYKSNEELIAFTQLDKEPFYEAR